MKNTTASRKPMAIDFEKSGTFSIGCNWWASHAGTNMWHDWRPEIVVSDFKKLAKSGLQIVRIFPLWSDFQPIQCMKVAAGMRREMRINEEVLGDDALGRAGLSHLMMERFKFVLDEAHQHNFKIIIGLLTGWMSGRLYIPPAFENLDVLTHPFPIMWEIRFVKAFVHHFKGHPAIAAWESGNESNCLGRVPDRETAFLWCSTINNAIKAVDNTRPVISGMHSLKLGNRPYNPDQNNWLIEDQAETSDVLTTHPYPLFVPHCNQDPINEIRNVLHATAESRLYADIGGKPCMVEEIGTLGPMICSEEVAATYTRATLFSSYAHDCHSFIWWCGFDQDHLVHPPYDWASFERELGIFRKDGSAKPLAGTFKEFSDFLKDMPVLPERTTEAVCILTDEQDQWGAAYSSFILAKQAGFDIEFQHIDQPIKKSPLYLMPSLCGGGTMRGEKFKEVVAQVRQGAHLYMSISDALLSPFNEITGLKTVTRESRSNPATYKIDSLPGVDFSTKSLHKLRLDLVGAKVLGSESDGNPCFTSYKLGKGFVYVLTVPIEQHLSTTPGSFHAKDALPFWKIYSAIAKPFVSGRIVSKDHPSIGITEHPVSKSERIIIMINHSPAKIAVKTTLKASWKIKKAIRGNVPSGENPEIKIAGNDAVIFRVAR